MTDICSNDEVFAMLGNSSPTPAEIALMHLLRPMTEDAVRTHVGYTITQQSHTHYLPETDDLVGEETGIDVVNNRVTFEYSGASEYLFLPERPVRSITSLYKDEAAYAGQGSGDFGAATEQTAGTDFYVDWLVDSLSWSGRLVSIAGTWPHRARTVKVTYTAGMTAGELAGASSIRGPRGVGVMQLKYATILAASIAFKEPQSLQGSNSGPVTAERLADYSVQYSARDVSRLFGLQYDLPAKVKSLLEPFRRYGL